jgi:hypothetical protein
VTPPIVEQRRYRVVAPDQYTVSADLVSLHLWDDTEAGQYTVELFGRRASFPATDLPASPPDPGRRGHLQSSITEPVPLVTSTGDVPYLTPLVITNEALDTQWEVTVPARVNGCDGSDEGICIGGLSHSHVFELPGEGAGITRCLGNGCGHANLPTANMAGDATVRITYTDPDGGPEPSRSSASWHTTERGDFRGDPVVLPTTPRLDADRTELQDPIGGFAMPSTSIRGTVTFDRPVTGEIRVDAVVSPDNVGCDRDPIAIGPEPTQTVVVNLTGLCRDSIYSFPASVVDADGNAAEIAGRSPLAGFTRAPTVRWSFDVEVTAVHGGDAVTLEGGAFAFDDKSLAAGDDRCLQAGYHVTSPPHTAYRPVEDSLLGPTFTVGATFQLRDGCHDASGAARTERWETELSTDLLEALFFSGGRTQTVTVEVAGEVVDYTVRIRIDHIDRPTCTGGVCPSRA